MVNRDHLAEVGEEPGHEQRDGEHDQAKSVACPADPFRRAVLPDKSADYLFQVKKARLAHDGNGNDAEQLRDAKGKGPGYGRLPFQGQIGCGDYRDE